MIYNDKLKVKNNKYKKLNFTSFKNGINTEYDEYLTPINYSRNTYNFNFHNGALTTGLGIRELTFDLPDYNTPLVATPKTPAGLNVLGAYGFDSYSEEYDVLESYMILYCDNTRFYLYAFGENTPVFLPVPSLYMNSLPTTAVNYNHNGYNSVIYSTKDQGMWIHNDRVAPINVPDAPIITSMCVHFERLFVTVDGAKNEVWFSDDLDPTNWNVSLTEAGFIQLTDERGASNKVISLHDYVYVFRDYGISRITAYADQAQFSVNQMYLSGTKIYPNTVCACGDNIFFLSEDGIHVFDGNSVTKINLNIDSFFDNFKNSIGAYYNGKYYLATALNYNDGKLIGSENEVVGYQYYTPNNTLLQVDVKTGEITILRGVNIQYMKALNHQKYSKLVVCFKHEGMIKPGEITDDGEVLGVATKKYWESPNTDFGYPNNEKVIKEVYVKNSFEFTLTIKSDKEIKTFVVPSTTTMSKIKPNIKGSFFTFIFSSDYKDAHISNPQVIFGMV